MKLYKTHTRNQRRMYRIHKLEEKIKEQELLIGSLKQQNEFLMKQDNILQSLMQWLYEQEKYANDDESIILDVIDKIKELKEIINNDCKRNV